MLTKQLVYLSLQKEVENKYHIIENSFSDLNSAVQNDSKSTAGDKHETGRAMMHLEQEKLSQQLNSINELKEALAKINPEDKHVTIQFGSLVQTNKGYFFFSIGLGKIQVKNESVFCLSITTPLGKLLAGKKKGDIMYLNGEIEILHVE